MLTSVSAHFVLNMDPQLQALVKLRWIHWSDFLGLFLTIAFSIVACVKGGLFIIAPSVVFLLWVTLLCFRASYFIVHLLADVKLLPEKAARIALPYLNRNPELPPENTWPSFKVQLPYLRQVGWVRSIDIIILLLLAALWSTGIWAMIEGWELQIRAAFIFSALVNTLWIVMLLFRMAHFILHCTSEIKLLPYEASRLIIIFQRQLPT